MNVQRISAFSDGERGGNPAGVVIADAMPDTVAMRETAAAVGYSETAFAAPVADGSFRVRYFSPESEVPFCGHATIALGAALAERFGAGRFDLRLNDASITVEGIGEAGVPGARLVSPPTRSRVLSDAERAPWLALFGLDERALSPDLAAAHAHAGADHVVLPLARRETLRAMRYGFDEGQRLMREKRIVTVMLVWAESRRLFHARNAFASGGVREDPATGAAAAAFAGYLRDVDWPHGGAVTVHQGDDMGAPSRIHATIGDVPGTGIAVSGTVRHIEP